MEDLTCIFLTVNRVPIKWAEYQKSVLLKAIGKTKVITISKEPLDWGENIIQHESISQSNVYWQMLKGARIAKTPYVAIAEDDVLYTNEHFPYRPPLDTFAYNMNRWQIFTWDPVYSHKHRIGNFALIAPRELMIEALEERFNKYPDGTPPDKTGELGRPRIEIKLRLKPRKIVEFYSGISNVVFHHDYEMCDISKRHRKRMGAVRAYDVPFWGKATDLVEKFK